MSFFRMVALSFVKERWFTGKMLHTTFQVVFYDSWHELKLFFLRRAALSFVNEGLVLRKNAS